MVRVLETSSNDTLHASADTNTVVIAAESGDGCALASPIDGKTPDTVGCNAVNQVMVDSSL